MRTLRPAETRVRAQAADRLEQAAVDAADFLVELVADRLQTIDLLLQALTDLPDSLFRTREAELRHLDEGGGHHGQVGLGFLQQLLVSGRKGSWSEPGLGSFSQFGLPTTLIS